EILNARGSTNPTPTNTTTTPPTIHSVNMSQSGMRASAATAVYDGGAARRRRASPSPRYPLAQGGAHRRREIVEAERFAEQMRACFDRVAHGVHLVGVTGNEEPAQVLPGRREALGEVLAAHPRHDAIGDEQINRIGVARGNP